MQIQPKISIIVPVYKVEPYLGTCLESVLSQTYQNLEIILVDDGSPDQCGTICDQYALKDNRIRVIHQENQGLSGARNSGIDLVTGEYITFIDSDDFIDICMIELMVEQLDDMTDIVACGTVYCDESGQKLSEEKNSQLAIFEFKEQMVQFFKNKNYTTTAWGKLYSRKLFESIRYPVGKYHEDVFTTYQLVALSRRTVLLNRSFYWYRQVASSIIHQSFSLKHLDSIEASLQRYEFMKSYDLQLSKIAEGSIVYSCCRCMEKMVQADYYDEITEQYICNMIRKHLFSFLCFSQNSLKTKGFACMNALSSEIVRSVYKLLFVR